MNNHIEHIEDLLLTGNTLKVKEILQTFQSQYNVRIKYDGVPSIFYGINPENNKRFIAKKSIFNKVPILYHSAEEIDNSNLPDNLKRDFKICLEVLAVLPFTSGIIQGDLMFTGSTKRIERIDGELRLCCQPNLLIYTLPDDCDTAALGIAWHTRYAAPWMRGSLKSMLAAQPIYGEDYRELFGVDCGHYIFPYSVSGFLKRDTSILLDSLIYQFQLSSNHDFKMFKDKILLSRLRVVLNSYIRNDIKQPENILQDLIINVSDYFTKQTNKLKTDVSKEKKKEEWRNTLQEFSCITPSLIENTFKAMRDICDLKINILSDINDRLPSCWIKIAGDGMCHRTDHEGIVVVHKGVPIKLVDREQFAYMNFSGDYVKGWST